MVAADVREVPDLRAWERWIAHAGYVGEGLLYLLIGSFALLATIDATQRPNGTQGVLIRLSRTAPRKLLLVAIALGLASFVTWQLLVAIRDPEHRRDRNQRFRALIRAEHLFSGLLHAVLVIEATKILFGFAGNANSERTQKEWIARAFGAPLGRYVVGAVAVGILLYGLYQCYRAVTANRDSRVDLSRARLKPILDVLGGFGLVSRGAMFLLIGACLIRAAWHSYAGYAVGVAGALGSLRHRPYGGWALGAMAAGLFSYGLWQIVKEPYRRLRDS